MAFISARTEATDACLAKRPNIVRLRASRLCNSGVRRSGIHKLLAPGKVTPGGITPTMSAGASLTRIVLPITVGSRP
jgi:hypothetical protein